eukprot:19234-Heterococcus_DN1.PRE.2
MSASASKSVSYHKTHQLVLQSFMHTADIDYHCYCCRTSSGTASDVLSAYCCFFPVPANASAVLPCITTHKEHTQHTTTTTAMRHQLVCARSTTAYNYTAE